MANHASSKALLLPLHCVYSYSTASDFWSVYFVSCRVIDIWPTLCCSSQLWSLLLPCHAESEQSPSWMMSVWTLSCLIVCWWRWWHSTELCHQLCSCMCYHVMVDWMCTDCRGHIQGDTQQCDDRHVIRQECSHAWSHCCQVGDWSFPSRHS